jgi:hypothetical protein
VDAGNSIVDPRYRGQHLVARLAAGVIELCRDGGFLGFHHYPTTVHSIMQKLALAGGTETGIMLDYIPSGTEYREIEGSPRPDRPAAVVVYHPLRAGPAREVFAPQFLAPLIQEIYTRASLPRALRFTNDTLPALATRLRSALNPRRGLLRVEVDRIGADVQQASGDAVQGIDAPVFQVDLPMADPAVPAACDALRSLGFFFSAVMPEYLDGDVLRLQRLRQESVAVPDLVSDEAKRIFQVIREAQRNTLER